MESYLAPGPFNLVTPDGYLSEIHSSNSEEVIATVRIEEISPAFIGYDLEIEQVTFNIKSTLAQLGLNAASMDCHLDKKSGIAHVRVHFTYIGRIGRLLLSQLEVGCYVGKLFALEPSRKVRNADYLLRMFERYDRNGLPLLRLGTHGSKDLHLEKKGDKTVAFLALKKGTILYDKKVESFLPTLIKALKKRQYKTRELLKLHQVWQEGSKRILHENELLLVKTSPLHIRTAFAKVAEEFLPTGYHHTTASVLQPDTKASGDIYELYGESETEITHIPLEFYTLEPHREHVFFSDRDQLQSSLDNPKAIFKAFQTAPQNPDKRTAVFIVKGEQMLNLKAQDWIERTVHTEQFPGLHDLSMQAHLVEEYIKMQPSYPFLKAIESGLITSQGVLFSRYFPSPLMKKLLLGDIIQTSLKGIYFQKPSQSHGEYFSHEDRTTLLDLAKFGIPVFWADEICGKILQYAPKPGKDSGMFVPTKQVDTFIQSTVFGVYGSTLIELAFEKELKEILQGILSLKQTSAHPLLNPDKPLSLITGGGPGVMETGNRVAKELNILSCANIVDFTGVEQRTNPFIDAKMTYRLDRLVERQGEFNLDFPIFLLGGIGTDFEFALEQVRRKVGTGIPTPALLLGPTDYWRGKITSGYIQNCKSGTNRGAEWVSNCFYAVDNAEKALSIYQKYFAGKLPIGPKAPPAPDGFFA